MRKDVENYTFSSEYDLATAKHLLTAGRYVYVIFMCHMSLEKMLKAIFSKRLNRSAPKTHNLLYLVKETNTELPPEHFDFVSKINNASIVTRYPEDFSKLISSYPRRVTKEYLEKTERIFSWLKQYMKSI
jgi:HEPN domain-containing protein